MFRVYGNLSVPDTVDVNYFNISQYCNAVATNDKEFRCCWVATYNFETRTFQIEGTSNRPHVVASICQDSHSTGTYTCVRCYEIRPDYSQKFKEDSIVLNYHANDSQFVLNREINIL